MTLEPPTHAGHSSIGVAPKGASCAERAMVRLSSPAIAALAMALATAPPGAARAELIDAPSRVVAATLYPSNGTILRRARFAAPVGAHTLVLGGLPRGLDPDSVRISGVGDFEILGVAQRVEPAPAGPEPSGERAALLEQIEEKRQALRVVEDALSEARSRIAYMETFRRATAGPESAGELFERMDDWTAAWSMIRAEVEDAQAAARTAERRAADLREEISELEAALRRAGPEPRPTTTLAVDIVVRGEGVSEAGGVLEVSYVTYEASWTPLYDLRLDTLETAGLEAPLDAPIGARALTIVRRAAIQQRTGEAWEDVRLTLSTARPIEQLWAPEPRTPRARLLRPNPPPMEQSEVARGAVVEDAVLGGFVQPAEPETAADERSALTRYAGETVVYRLVDPVSAPGDGEVRRVQVDAETIVVETEVRATPEIDERGYLYALYDNGDAPLLPGRAAVYRDGAYFGQYHVPYAAPRAETALPFGPYDGVRIGYVVVDRADGEEGIFRTSNRRRARFSLSAENVGDMAVSVILYDNIPYSETEDIEVTFVGSTPPSENPVEGRRGAIAWRFALEPGEKEMINFGYDISWPEGEQLVVE